jgi:shikimate dehydrogenase
VKAENLETAIAGLKAIGVHGFNITIPHKQTIIPLLADRSDIAQSVGAVNTVWRTEKGWYGTNTDVEGFLAPLLAKKPDWQETEAVILGNGGAARAVVAGCSQLKCQKIHTIGRNWEKLQQFQESWQTAAIPVDIQIHLWEELPELLPYTGLLVNTTPIGMSPHTDASPIDATQMQWLPPNAIAYDLIYTPRPTKFLQIASSQGLIAIDGLEMLVQQGASALRRWLRQDVPVSTMRNTLQEHLAAKSQHPS